MKNKKIYIWIGVLTLLLTACGAKGDFDDESTMLPLYEQSEETPEETEGPVEDMVEQSFMGHWEYTGYMDECIQWTEYDDFVGCDYDGDGLEDRVYRVYPEDPNTEVSCGYRVEFGNGEVIQIERCTETGFPQIQHGDLNGDGRQEILFTQTYPTSTDPSSFGNAELYEWTEEGYQVVPLPFSKFPHESHTYCLNVQYDPLPNNTLHATVLENDFQMDVEFDEESWVMVGDYEVRDDYAILSETILVQEEGKAYLECHFGILGKWCEDQIVARVVRENDTYQIEEMNFY